MADTSINGSGENEEFDRGWSIYKGGIKKTSWDLILSVPNHTLYQNLNYMQRINGITYVIIGLLLLLFFVVIYVSILRPIREQTLFMNYYAKNRKSRMEVKSHNEMGILAENLNAMLDDIDMLTEDNLKSKEQVLEANYQKKQSELLAYRNQINPHFMHNTFECIRGMALLYEVPDIAEISEALSRFFSYNVRGKGYATIREIADHIHDYASIIGYRFMNKYTISIEIEEDVMEQCMPKMIIQPLVENAVFHGLEPKEESGTVGVFVGKEKERLAIRVCDSGCGMDEKEKIDIYAPTNGDDDVIVNYVNETKKTTSLYDSSKLKTRDKYGVFLGGNTSVIDIKTVSTSQKRLLVVKDSFADCFIPFLTPHYREIVVVDPRY